MHSTALSQTKKLLLSRAIFSLPTDKKEKRESLRASLSKMVTRTEGEVSLLFQRLTPFPVKMPLQNKTFSRHITEPIPSPAPPSPPDDHFAVGLEVEKEDLGERYAEVKEDGSPAFVRGIMHKVVDPRCFVAKVKYSASAKDIAERYEVTEGDVQSVWLCGVTTPPCGRKMGKGMRLSPQSVLEVEEGLGCDVWGGLDEEEFRELFEGGKSVDEEVMRFGNALIERLERLGGRVEGRKKRVARVGGCGFSEGGSHVDLDVLCESKAICKTGSGLYRTARSAGRLSEGRWYWEVVVVEDCDVGGVCIGVSGDGMGLNKLIGSGAGSCGIHSSGQIVSRGGEFVRYGRGFGNGDRVGCVANVRRRGERWEVRLEFWINGERQGEVGEDLWDGQVEGHVHAAVSLYKKGSKAVIRCCRKDWAMHVGEVSAICGGC